MGFALAVAWRVEIGGVLIPRALITRWIGDR